METIIQPLLEKIRDLTKERDDALTRIERTKNMLYFLANHIKDYSSGKMQNELLSLAEEFLK